MLLLSLVQELLVQAVAVKAVSHDKFIMHSNSVLGKERPILVGLAMPAKTRPKLLDPE